MEQNTRIAFDLAACAIGLIPAFVVAGMLYGSQGKEIAAHEPSPSNAEPANTQPIAGGLAAHEVGERLTWAAPNSSQPNPVAIAPSFEKPGGAPQPPSSSAQLEPNETQTLSTQSGADASAAAPSLAMKGRDFDNIGVSLPAPAPKLSQTAPSPLNSPSSQSYDKSGAAQLRPAQPRNAAERPETVSIRFPPRAPAPDLAQQVPSDQSAGDPRPAAIASSPQITAAQSIASPAQLTATANLAPSHTVTGDPTSESSEGVARAPSHNSSPPNSVAALSTSAQSSAEIKAWQQPRPAKEGGLAANRQDDQASPPANSLQPNFATRFSTPPQSAAAQPRLTAGENPTQRFFKSNIVRATDYLAVGAHARTNRSFSKNKPASGSSAVHLPPPLDIVPHNLASDTREPDTETTTPPNPDAATQSALSLDANTSSGSRYSEADVQERPLKAKSARVAHHTRTKRFLLKRNDNDEDSVQRAARIPKTSEEGSGSVGD